MHCVLSLHLIMSCAVPCPAPAKHSVSFSFEMRDIARGELNARLTQLNLDHNCCVPLASRQVVPFLSQTRCAYTCAGKCKKGRCVPCPAFLSLRFVLGCCCFVSCPNRKPQRPATCDFCPMGKKPLQKTQPSKPQAAHRRWTPTQCGCVGLCACEKHETNNT